MTFHPWRRLRELQDVEVLWRSYEVEDELGCFNFCSRRIVMDSMLTQAERRSTLAHELMHIERGGPVPPHMVEREEFLCERDAGRLLIEIKPLGEAMAWSTCMDEVAEEMWVDRPMLDVRLHTLHPAESFYLARRLKEIR